MRIIRKTRILTELLADLVDELLFIKNKSEQAYGLVVVYYPDYTRLDIKEFLLRLMIFLLHPMVLPLIHKQNFQF